MNYLPESIQEKKDILKHLLLNGYKWHGTYEDISTPILLEDVVDYIIRNYHTNYPILSVEEKCIYGLTSISYSSIKESFFKFINYKQKTERGNILIDNLY